MVMTSLVIGAQSTFKNIWLAWSETSAKFKTKFIQARTKEALLRLNDSTLKDLGYTRSQIQKWH